MFTAYFVNDSVVFARDYLINLLQMTQLYLLKGSIQDEIHRLDLRGNLGHL